MRPAGARFSDGMTLSGHAYSMPGGMSLDQKIVSFQNGRLTCRVRGDQVVLAMEYRPDRPGLYRGVLRGAQGEWDLGLLLPEGGCLRLCRSIPVRELERAGCWPVAGAEAVLRHAFSDGGGSALPQGWKKAGDVSARFPHDPILAHAAGETPGWVVRDLPGGAFSLAVPWEPGMPLPLVPAFCFARICFMAGKRWAMYRFSQEGRPVMPEAAD